MSYQRALCRSTRRRMARSQPGRGAPARRGLATDHLRQGAPRDRLSCHPGVPTELVSFLAELLAAERRARGTRTGARALTCDKQAIFALVWFRERRDVAPTGRGLGISQATACRYLDEAIDVLAAPRTCTRSSNAGTMRAAARDPGRQDRGHRSAAGQGHQHEGHNNRCLVPGQDPRLRRQHPSRHASRRVPGLDLRGRAGRGPRPGRRPRARPGAGVHTPAGQPAGRSGPDISTRTRDTLLRSLRCLGERSFALLAGRWRALRHIVASPRKITKIARAALVLTRFEHGCLAC